MANSKTGVVLAVGQPQQLKSKSGKTFVKRSLYLDCTTFDPYTGQRSQYENKILFDFMESKTSLLDNIQVGQIVTISFDLQGSEITEQNGRKKYFTHVRPYNIEVRQMQPQHKQSASTQPVSFPPQDNDDAPF